MTRVKPTLEIREPEPTKKWLKDFVLLLRRQYEDIARFINYDNPRAYGASNSDPTVNDDADRGFREGSVWVNLTTDEFFICLDASIGAAVWSTPVAADPTGFGGGIGTGQTLPWETFTRKRIASIWWNTSLGVDLHRMPQTNGTAGSSEAASAADPLTHGKFNNFSGAGIQQAYERTGKNYVRVDTNVYFRVAIRVRQLRSPGEQRVVVVMTDDVAPATWNAIDTAPTKNHFGFMWSEKGGDSNWYAMTGNNTTGNRSDTGVSVSTSTVLLECLYRHGVNATFAINGVLKATISTNLPNGGTPTFGWIVLFSSDAPSADNAYTLFMVYIDEDAPWVNTSGIDQTFLDFA